MKTKKICNFILTFFLIITLSFQLCLTTYAAKPKEDIISSKTTNKIFFLKYVTMIVINETEITSNIKNKTITLSPGEIVYADTHSMCNEKILIEYNGTLYVANCDDFCVVIGSETVINMFAEQLKELYQQKIYEEQHALELKRIAQGNSEYPVAAYVWKYLRDEGFNEYVTAGIIGNMMMECGGCTLDLQPFIYGGYDDNFYGLCQWYNKYCEEVLGASVEDQCKYLVDTMPEQFRIFGWISGYTYEEFCEITNEREAALAFAQIYERCGTGSYEKRQRFSETALAYFTQEN